ncbi:MAG TPA: FAD-binding oxidoreductase [Thermomicrobiales bacterium]|nr:FAD-binding oxidoreductase [Thermomicrobiales bacterium]
MAERAEVAIVGGGIMGASLAFALTRRGVRDVLILERRTAGSGATGKTGALLRQHYSNRPEAMLAHLSLLTFKHWRDVVGGDCGYVPCGLIATVATSGPDDPNVAHLRANVALQQSVGIKAEVVTPDDLRALQPFARFDDLVVAAYEAESGYVDSIAATRGLLDAALARGARLRERATVTGIRVAGGRAVGLETSDGPVDAGAVVCAAGAWAAPLLATAGVRVPLEPIRVQVAIVNRPDTMPRAGTMAYVDTAAGIFCRNYGPNRTLLGIGGGEFHEPVDPDDYDEGNDAAFPALALDYLARRMPPMRAATYLYGHAGLYDMTPDAHPIIGPTPGVAGLYLCVGFSGAGFKKGPAIGQCLAELVADGRATTVDLTPFRLDRFDDDGWRHPWSEHEYVLSTDFGHKF